MTLFRCLYILNLIRNRSDDAAIAALVDYTHRMIAPPPLE